MKIEDQKDIDQRDKRWSILDKTLGSISAVLLIAMILLTCTDVVARYFFNSPVNGAFELTQMLLAALIFTALPMTTAANEHIDVELLTQMTGKRARRFFANLGLISIALVMFVMSWRLGAHALRLAHDGAVSNSLSLPFAPIGYFASIGCAISGFIALYTLYQNLWPMRKRIDG